MSYRWSAVVIPALLGALGLSSPSAKVLLRYHPRLGTVTRFRTRSHYFLQGEIISGPRPDRALTLFGTDSVVNTGGDSIVRLLMVDSLVQTTSGESAGVLRTRLLMEGTWTDHRALRGEIRGVGSLNALRHMVPDVLDGAVSLPDDSVGVGDSWKAEGTYQVVEVGDTLGALRARLQAKLEALTVQGTDTTAVIHVKVRLEGPPWFYKAEQQTQQMLGSVEGDEVFSVSRGVTDSLWLSGTVSTEFDLGGGGRSAVGTELSLVRVNRQQP